jgi:hypothetical protein
MKPQRPQRKTLCPQKDLPVRERSERQGVDMKSVTDRMEGCKERHGKKPEDKSLLRVLCG